MGASESVSLYIIMLLLIQNIARSKEERYKLNGFKYGLVLILRSIFHDI